VRAELDENKYPKGMKISDAKLAAIKLVRHAFHVTGTTPYHHNDLKRLFMHNPLADFFDGHGRYAAQSGIFPRQFLVAESAVNLL